MILIGLPVLTALLFGLAFFVFRSRPHSPVNRWFSAFTLFTGMWTFGITLSHLYMPSEYALRLTFVGASMAPAAFLAFLRYYPTPNRWPSLPVLRFVLLAGAGLSILSIATPLVASNPVMAASGFERQVGPLYPVFTVYMLLVCGLDLSMLLARFHRATGVTRLHLLHLALGLTLASSGALTSNLLLPAFTGRTSHTYLGPYFLTPFVLLTAHSIIRHRLLDLRLVVHRGLTIAIASALSLIPVGLFLLLFRPLTTGPGWTESLGFLTALVAVTLLVPPTRDLAGHLLDRYLYRSRLGFAETVGQVSRTLRRVFRLRALATGIAPPIRSATGAEGVLVFVRDEDGVLRAIGSCLDPAAQMRPVEQLPPVVDDALRGSERLIADDDHAEADFPTEVHPFLRTHRIAVIQAVVFEDSVIGAIAVGPKLSGDPFYAHDLTLLTTLANQAGIAIKNAQLYTEVVLANEYLTNVLATIESGVISINAAGRVLMFNRAAEELTGLPAEAVRGRPMAETLPPVLERLLRVTRDTGQRQIEPELALSAGETTRPVICTTSPVRDPGGEIIGAVSVFSDLTLLKELEAQRQRAERLAYFEVLAASLAHEIKNPLVAIKAFTQLVPRRSRDDAFIEEFSRVVSREIGRMERLVDRLRVLSRPGARPRGPLDVRAPLQDALEFLQPVFEEKQLTLTAHLPPEPAIVVGDEAELEQLFINLLMNAREATPSGGTVAVTLSALAGAVQVAVADSGPGIPPELLGQVFEPFFTTKARGSGLGLAISSAIAESHGARIWAANREEGGAVFTVELPTPPPVDASRPSMNPAT